jgi:hypothetical protein
LFSAAGGGGCIAPDFCFVEKVLCTFPENRPWHFYFFSPAVETGLPDFETKNPNLGKF